MSATSLRRSLVACLATLSLLWVGPTSGPASAAPTWLPGKVVSDPSHESADVRVADTPGGHTMVAWHEQVGTTYLVRVSERGPGGLWSVPLNVWVGQEVPSSVRLAVDDTGRAVVAFVTTAASGKQRARAAVRAPSGGWSTSKGFGADVHDTTFPDVALTPSEAVVVYRLESAAGQQVAVASSPDGSSWAGQTLSSAVDFVGDPHLAVDGSGAPVVAWNQTAGATATALAVSRAGDGQWSAPATLWGGNQVNVVDLVTSGRGDVVALWRTHGTSTYQLSTRTRPPGGTWSGAYAIVSPGDFQASPQLTVDASGRGTVVYGLWDGAAYQTQTLAQNADGTWAPPAALSPGGLGTLGYQVATAGSGFVTATWVSHVGSGYVLNARTRTGGSWGPTADLGPVHFSTDVDDSLGVDGSGNVIAAWEGVGTQHTVAQVKALDASGPALGAPVLPKHVYAGKAASFSVPQPDDAWSAVTQVSWTFGSGPSYAGLTATQKWAKPGTYPVTVTALDSLGNATTRTVQVRVHGQPQLSKVKLSRRQLHAGSGPRARTRLAFRLSAPGSVKVKVRGPGGVLVKLARHDLEAGSHALVLRTTMKGVHLRAGSYRVTLVATNPAGKGAARTVRMSVLG